MRVKTEAKRQAIVAAAAEVFQEAGFEGASMAVIATRVGGSKATLYSYFPSKEELFIEVMRTAGERQFQPIVAGLGDGSADPGKTLQNFGEKMLASSCGETFVQTRRALISESGRSDIGLRFFQAGPQKGLQQIAIYLETQMTLGRLKKTDPLLAAMQLNALLECETVMPLLLGVVKPPSPAQIRLAVRRALKTFFAAYAPETAC